MVGVKKTKKSKKTEESIISSPPCGCVRNEEGYWVVVCSEAKELWNSSLQAKTEKNPDLFISLYNAYFDHMRLAQSFQVDNSFFGGPNGKN